MQRTLSQSKQVGLFPCRGSVVPCRTLSVVSETYHGTVKPGFARPAVSVFLTRRAKISFSGGIISGLPVIRAFALVATGTSYAFRLETRKRDGQSPPLPVAWLIDGLSYPYYFGVRAAPWIACDPKCPLAGAENTNVMFENSNVVPPVTQTWSGDSVPLV